MFKVKKKATGKIYTVFAVQKDKFECTEFLIYDDTWEEENLYQECRSCRHKYSTLECELCVDFDMYEEAL